MKKLSTKTIPIGNIKPYWRNPRDNKEAVKKVAESISRYGYNNLIAVDKNNVIITGHTRHKALKQLNYSEVEVAVLDLDEQKAKEYRIIDNKSSEIAEWNDDLIPELREIVEIDFVDEFFDEDLSFLLDESTGSESFTDITEDVVKKKEKELNNKYSDNETEYKKQIFEAICPECGAEFDVRR
jgi:ParB-like chromosome segregation protein Spo0J